MPLRHSQPVILRVIGEEYQQQETRKSLYDAIEETIGRPLLAYFTSFSQPVKIESSDVDMIEGVLQTMDLTKGLAVLISSPGGDGIASERIVNLFRQYSKTGEFWTIVPSRAKSAATMICLGSSKIMMCPSSELGPIDPQVPFVDQGQVKWFSAWNIVKSYDRLFAGANRTKGNIEPYLQQLAKYDAREIEEFNTSIELSESIAVRTLKQGMMSRKTSSAIKKKIEMFLTPKKTKSHSRPIYAEEAKKCGLKIDVQEVDSGLWKACYELYLRLNRLVDHRQSKCIETASTSFGVSAVGEEDD